MTRGTPCPPCKPNGPTGRLARRGAMLGHTPRPREGHMLMTFAVLTAHTARRITELGALLGLLGGIALAASVYPSLRQSGKLAAGVLLALGFVLIIYALHFGKTF